MQEKNTNQKKFGAVEATIAVIAVVLIGLVGWLMISRQGSTDKSTTTSTPPAAANDGYLVIKEWGVKVKMKDSDKVTYTYIDSQKGRDDEVGKIESDVALTFNSEHLQNKDCLVGVGYTRYSSINEAGKTATIQLGDYFYQLDSSSTSCENAADDALKASIRADFGNIEAL